MNRSTQKNNLYAAIAVFAVLIFVCAFAFQPALANSAGVFAENGNKKSKDDDAFFLTKLSMYLAEKFSNPGKTSIEQQPGTTETIIIAD